MLPDNNNNKHPPPPHYAAGAAGVSAPFFGVAWGVGGRSRPHRRPCRRLRRRLGRALGLLGRRRRRRRLHGRGRGGAGGLLLLHGAGRLGRSLGYAPRGRLGGDGGFFDDGGGLFCFQV